MTRALHATAVNHYQHVLLAMSRAYDEVGILSRTHFSNSAVERLQRLRVPEKLLNLVNRRVQPTFDFNLSTHSFGPAELIQPLMSLRGLQPGPRLLRMISNAFAQQAARASRSYDVFHFIEGLGHLALANHEFRLSICESRSMHHQVFAKELDVVLGFPCRPRVSPDADNLDFEYSSSDLIVTYSNVAKRSFTQRGVDSERVKVVPIGLGPQLPRIYRERDPFALLFVGRADEYKGFDMAVAIVEELGRPYRLRFAGRMDPEVQKWAGDHPQIENLGYLDRADLRELYSSSSAMIVPSVESFGLAIAEAAYHGLPVVCSYETGVGEYLPPPAVRIVHGRDTAVWAEAVKEILLVRRRGDSVQINEILRSIDKSYERLTWGATAGSLADVYENYSFTPGKV